MRLRVLTYNIHKCVGGLDRRYDPDRTAAVIAHYEPDVLMLQEVARGGPRWGGEDQAARLGEAIGLRNRVWFANVRRKRFGEYGNAILSRFPLSKDGNIDVTVPPKKQRSVLHARCRVRIGRKTRTLHVFNMHLGLSGWERKVQLRRFLESRPFAHLHPRTPILVGGDFNDVWGTLGTAMLVPKGFEGPSQPLPTFPAFAPVRMLDSLYTRGDLRLLRMYAGRTAGAQTASDHLPLVADLKIKTR